MLNYETFRINFAPPPVRCNQYLCLTQGRENQDGLMRHSAQNGVVGSNLNKTHVTVLTRPFWSGDIKSRSLSSVRSVETWATHLSHQYSLSIEIASLKNFFYPSLLQLQEFGAFSQPGANSHIQLHISIPSTLAARLILNWDILEEIHGSNWLAPTLKMCLWEFTIKEWTNLVHRRLIQCCDLKLNPSLANSCDNQCNTCSFFLA